MRAIIRSLEHRSGYGVWFYDDANKCVAKPVDLIFDKVPEGYMLPEPTFTLGYEISQGLLQTMVNELINLGVRPNNDKVAGQYEATKEHLKDLQKLVDRLLNQLDKK